MITLDFLSQNWYQLTVVGLTYESIIALVIMLLLLCCSAIISGSEVAYFSLSPHDIDQLTQSEGASHKKVLTLLESPKTLLATILIANNFINIAIVVLSGLFVAEVFEFASAIGGLLFELVLITFLILLFGEVVPKVYANSRALTLSTFMAAAMGVLVKLFLPLSRVLINSTQFIERRINNRQSEVISVDELEQAVDLTYQNNSNSDEEQKILKGIVQFGNKEVKQIMTPRVEVIAINIDATYAELKETILESGYSRIPVYTDSIDNITGVIYIKDLLIHLNMAMDDWQKLIRPAYFIPENKKIDDLLQEFQQRKMHLGVVVDEYGGASGIATLEDVLEEIVGEITDEFDDDEITYSKLDDKNFVFEGKTQLVDMYKVLNISGEEFESEKGESGTLAGFLLEKFARIPKAQERFQFNNYTFTVEAADRRRVKRVKITVN